MEENITISVIEETGYKTWRDFYFKKTSYSGINGVYTYGYINTKNEPSSINLAFRDSILRILVLEESKLLLRYIDVKSFSALVEDKPNFSQGLFIFDIVVIDDDEHISYKKISISFDDAVRLSDLENNKYTYLVYEKKRVKGAQ